MRRVLFLLLIPVISCTAYVPLQIDSLPERGTEVRARLNPEGQVRLTGLLGRPVQHLEGRFLGGDPDSLRLGLISAVEFGRPWESVDTLRLARIELSGLDEKRVDRTRTTLAVGGGALATGLALAVLVSDGLLGNEGGDQEQPPDRILIPIFSIVH
jgi:hypothetical protein